MQTRWFLFYWFVIYDNWLDICNWEWKYLRTLYTPFSLVRRVPSFYDSLSYQVILMSTHDKIARWFLRPRRNIASSIFTIFHVGVWWQFVIQLICLASISEMLCIDVKYLPCLSFLDQKLGNLYRSQLLFIIRLIFEGCKIWTISINIIVLFLFFFTVSTLEV